MSQNPNYNPYGQNPPDPNAPPGTFYGSPPLPPGQSQGSTPNFVPNTPGPMPPGQNPNYGPYNPYTPNPPTPGPAVNPNYNPYDPYAPTIAGQGTTPDYNPYAPPAPPVPPPSKPPSGGISWKVIALVVLAFVVVVGGVAIGLVSYNTTQTNNAHATATAQTGTQTAHAQQTATAQANATAAAAKATTIATTYPFSDKLVLSDPLSDNSKGFNWETSSLCQFTGNAYHVSDPTTNTFSTCFGVNTNFSNFTFEAEMNVSKGDGGGLVFRGNTKTGQLYRVSFYTDGTYGVYVYRDTTGTNASTLKSANTPQSVDLTNTNTIGVVSRGTTISVYLNQTLVTTVQDSTYSSGQIGFSASNLTNSTVVIFSNIKVWALPPGS